MIVIWMIYEYDVRLNKIKCFCNEEKPMLGLFLKSRKPINLNRFHNEQKLLLGLFAKCWKPMNLNCFRNEQKSMLGLFPRSWKPMNLNCFHNEQSQRWDFFWSFENQWIWIAFAISEARVEIFFWGLQKTLFYKD
jgi:hypothetical protein